MLTHLTELEIKEKYLKPPSFDEIFGFIDEIGVSISQFERYYSIPYSVLRSVKRGVRPLPAKFWPIFYERIVPQYGIKYMIATNVATKPITKKRVAFKKTLVASEPDTLHDRLITVK